MKEEEENNRFFTESQEEAISEVVTVRTKVQVLYNSNFHEDKWFEKDYNNRYHDTAEVINKHEIMELPVLDKYCCNKLRVIT